MRASISWASVASPPPGAMPRWSAEAHSTAATTLANSTSRPSPVVLKTRPPWRAIIGSTIRLKRPCSRPKVPGSSASISRL